jgi:demethylmenaquinone methyltransferase/2-methoxy-6-polyprenyl-1,4-benzoquinol methylase
MDDEGLGRNEVLRVLQSKDEVRAFYNKISGVYDLLSERTEEPVRRAALEALGARPGERVLEIGFGTGHCLVKLARAVGPTGRVFGVDLSEEMLRISQRRVRSAGVAGRVELRRGDASKLPYPSGRFDAAFMSFTLELFDTPEIPKVLGECMRVLHMGGRLVVAGFSKEGPNGPIRDAFEWTHRHFPNFLDCRPIYVRRAIKEAGFQIENVRRMEMWVPVEVVLATKAAGSR